MQDYLEFIDEVLVDAPGIEKRVRELGEQISQDYKGEDLLVVFLLVEDIVDSGRTLAHVLMMLKTREPKSVKVCVLLDKKMRREVPVEIDYVGFDVPDKYIFGYGIDIDENFRYLPFIATADLVKYIHPAE